MKIILLIFLLVVYFSCSEKVCETKLSGVWKIEKVSYAGKDISKSSDIKNNNEIKFSEAGYYEITGMPKIKDNGRFFFKECSKIVMRNKKGAMANFSVAFDLDTLNLLSEDSIINMILIRK